MENAFERRAWLVPLLLFGLAVVLLRPLVLPFVPGTALDGHDFTGNVYPLYEYTAEQVRAGELPLWNPRQFAGFPVAGNPQAALFYPATWVVWGLSALGVSVPRAIGIMLVLHVWLAGWGAAALARRLGAVAAGGLAAGVVYAMSGWAGARLFAGHYTILTTYAWLPWVVVGYAAALERRTPWALLPAVGALGIMALAGHPQMVLYAVISAALLLASHMLAPDADPFAVLWGGVWRLALICLGGVLLGAALVLPTGELTAASSRSGTDIAFVNSFALRPSQLPTLVLPFLYGNPTAEPLRYWGGDTFEEMSAYAGLLPLVALLLAYRLRDRRVIFPLLCVGIGLALSVGVEGVLFDVVVRWIPGFSLFRAPGRFLFFVALGLAGLTAILFSHLMESTPDRRRHTLAPALRAAPWLAAALFVGSVYFSGWFASASHVEPMPGRAEWVAGTLGLAGLVALGLWGVLALLSDRDRRLFRVGLACALAFVTLDAWRAVVPVLHIGEVAPGALWSGVASTIPTDTVGRVRAFANPNDYLLDTSNIASRTGHLNVEGYDPLEISSYAELARGVEVGSLVYDLFGVQYVATWEPREDEGYALIGVSEGSIVYENPDPFPRAWVTVNGELIQDDDAARARIRSGEVNLRETVILSEPLDCELGDTPTDAQITVYRPNDVTVEVSGTGGVLVLSDQYYPGWQATIDGEPVPIARAYTTLRAVCVPPGDHTVTFRYRPRSVWAGAGISAVGWALWGVGTLFNARRRRAL